jgi:hypothetical protein
VPFRASLAAVLRRALALGLAAAFAPLGQATAATWGGPQTTSTGEVVTVLLSDAYSVDPAVPSRWAEWAATKLPHARGDLEAVRFLLLPPVEIAAACVAPVDGCYLRERRTVVAPGEDFADGTSAATVIAHEFGHHLSTLRLNPPWSAFEYGPKRWATAVRACPRVRAATAFVGDTGGSRYGRDVGEAWAETYAHAAWRASKWEGGWWPPWPWYLDASFRPTARTLELALLDALVPWRPMERIWRGRLRPGQTARLAIAPLDGVVRARLVDAPADAKLSLRAGSRLLAGPARRAAATVCGERRLSLRVSSRRGGVFSVALQVP